MSPVVVATITAAGTVVGLVIAMWTILGHFDRRNADRFDALQKQIESTRDSLQKQIDSTRDGLQKQIELNKELLRAELREMRAELRLEIREAGDRRVTSK